MQEKLFLKKYIYQKMSGLRIGVSKVSNFEEIISEMKYTSSLLHGSKIAFFIVFLTMLAFTAHNLDSRLVFNKHIAYEGFIKQSVSALKISKPINGKGSGEMDSPEFASLQEFFATVDPALQRVPAERLVKAYHSISLFESELLKSGAYQMQWTGTSAEMGGRTRAIMWDPLVPNKVWAGGVTGGLWYNENIISATGEWQPVNDMWDNLAISCIVNDPVNPLTMYVGTGEAQTALITYRESGGRGVGIWKTTDGGQSWVLLPSTSQFAYVTKIAVRNEAGNSVIYAGVASGIYHGTQQSQPSDGLYRSVNGGQSWQQVLPDITGLQVPYCVNDVTLGADGRIYVGTMQNAEGKGGAVLLYSDQGTPGSWTKYETVSNLIQAAPVYKLPGRVVIATSKSNANILYAAFGAGFIETGDRLYYYGEYLYRSNNKGVTWTPVNLPGGSHNWANLSWHAMTLGVDPNNPEIIYAGGLDQWRSLNGGASWEHLSDWALMYNGGGNKYIHADQHAIEYKPGSSSTMIFGTDGGVFLSENGNATTPVFKQRNKNYNTLQFYTCAMNPVAGNTGMIGGLQDNGTLYYQGVPLSIDDMITGGDGAYCFWDQDNPAVYITSTYFNRYYVFENNMYSNTIDRYSGVFINPADFSSQLNTLYANACDFWGVNADKLLRVPNIPSANQGSFISANTGSDVYFSHVKVSPYSAGTSHNLFVGTVSGKLYKITNANSTPVSAEIGSASFPTGNISCVAVGGSEDTLLVTFTNYGVSSVWQTYNGGLSWKEVEGNLPDMPVRWAIYHPQNSKQALVATELGVWSTSNLHDANVLWTPQTLGMANVRVDMLILRNSDNTVLAASHGRGLFTASFPIDINTPAIEYQKTDNQFIVLVNQNGIIVQSDSNSPSEYTVFSSSGQLVAKGKIASGPNRELIPVKSLARGVYIVKIQAGNNKFTKKLVL